MKYLLALFLAGCTVSSAKSNTPDAGAQVVTSVYLENKAKWVTAKYYPRCVQLCYRHTGSDECPDKCERDFHKILELMVRSVRSGKEAEDDFDAMMEGWYGYDVRP